MSENRTRARGLIDPSDVLDWQTGSNQVVTVDGDFIPRSRVYFPEVAPYAPSQRPASKSIGNVAISGLDDSPKAQTSQQEMTTGGPHPETVSSSATPSVGHVTLLPSPGGFPLTPPDARDFL